MMNNEISFEKALEYLINKGVTAYEVHKFSGLSQAGLRKLFNGLVDKPQRKTKEVVLNYYNHVLSSNNLDVKEVRPSKEDDFFTEENIDIIRTAILLYENKLLEDKVVNQWLQNKLLTRENEILKIIKQKK